MQQVHHCNTLATIMGTQYTIENMLQPTPLKDHTAGH